MLTSSKIFNTVIQWLVRSMLGFNNYQMCKWSLTKTQNSEEKSASWSVAINLDNGFSNSSSYAVAFLLKFARHFSPPEVDQLVL